MDKLKIVKAVVFVLTFGMVFVLCLGISQIIKGSYRGNFSIKLDLPENVQAEQIVPNGDRLYVVSGDRRITVIDVTKGKAEGIIYLSGGSVNE